MLAPCSGWELGCFSLRQVQLWAGAGRWACRACQARPYGSGGGGRWPGSEAEVPPPGPARRTLKEWTLQVSPFGRLRARLPCHLTAVTIDKLQGSSVTISTKDGLLKAKYLYTESSFLSSAAGDITLGSVHGNITLQSKMGNITVDSSSGCLKASTHQGAIDVYVSQLGKVELKSHKGSIIVKVPSSLQAHLQLSGKETDVNSEVFHVREMAVRLMNQASKHEKWIKANAPKGTVSFRRQSWFQSLKLQD
uniref:Family with sequence similarity 185 member A n=1 Tax=Aotus nancymaae TaxID=37293 RepID=A0A2K5CTK2_AOTNA